MTEETRPTRRLVARFYNEDGAEMPALYHDEEHGLICPWNYLHLVAPHIEAALRQIGTPAHVPKGFDPTDWWQHTACKRAQTARETLGITAEELTRTTWQNTTEKTAAVTGRDGATPARPV